MPRPRKAKTASNAGAATTQKGSTTGSNKTKKTSSNVSQTQQNSKASETSSLASSGPAKRQTGRGRKAKVSAGSDGGSSTRGARGQTAARGGRGRGRSKQSVAVSDGTDSATTDDLQEDGGTGRGAGLKRKQKMRDKDQQQVPASTTRSSPSKQRRRSAHTKALDDDDFLERQLSAQSVAKWQTMTKTSQEFLHQIVDGAISVVLNETSDSSYDGVQDHLNNLKRRLMTNFVSLKVPNKRQPNYREMEKHTRLLEAALVETSNQVECLDKEVRLQQQLLEQKEEELEKLEEAEQRDNQDNSQDITKKLHPLLQDDRQDVLGLPPLRKGHHDQTSRQFEDVRSSCQQQVLESLHHWRQGQGEGAARMAEFLDAVSAIQAALPQ